MSKEWLSDPVSPNSVLECFSNRCDDPGSNRTIQPSFMRGSQRYILRGPLASHGRIDDQPARSCDLPWVREIGHSQHHKDGDQAVSVINQRSCAFRSKHGKGAINHLMLHFERALLFVFICVVFFLLFCHFTENLSFIKLIPNMI